MSPVTRSGLRRRLLVSALGLAACLGGITPVSPVLAGFQGGPLACRVVNVRTGTAYTGTYDAVAEAQSGDKLRLRGICRGTTKIPVDLTIVGVRPRGAPRPTLSGNDVSTVLSIAPGTSVEIRGIVIRDGNGDSCLPDYCAGGINVSADATLRLVDSIVRDNEGPYEGGVQSHGTLSLAGRTRVIANTATDGDPYAGGISVYAGTLIVRDRAVIRGNTGGYGGGLYNQGTVVLEGEASIRSNHATESGGGVYNEFAGDITLRDSASIHHNRSDLDAGGIANDHGATLTLEDSSSIHHNRAVAGGGVLNAAPSTLTLAGSASVHHNRTLTWGGGIWNNGSLTLAGSSSVHHNRSDGHASGIYTYGPTLLSGDASVHDNDSHATRNSGAIEIPGFGQVFTMEDASSVSDNIGGPRGGGIVLWPACETPAVITGATARTSGNTPGQIVTRIGTGAICD
jgi:hypothetical protein